MASYRDRRSTSLAEIRPNRAKHKLQRGEVVNIISGHNSADTIDFLGPLGFDGVWIEGEHGPIDFADIPDLTRACDLWGMTSVVRVNQNNAGMIYRTFDVGAQGVVIPHINTAEEARAVVDAAKFAPIGHRGMFGSRQANGVSDYVAKANDETLVVILIEDIIAVNNLDEILKVDNIDVFFVAPSDLAQSMGYIGQISHPEVQATIDGAIAKITSAGRTAGSLVTDDNVEDYIRKGSRFLMTGWPQWVTSGARNFLQKASK
jgi:4-hydroxy-2-oxoheptanedioate aldolase